VQRQVERTELAAARTRLTVCSAKRNAQSSPLHALPPELRNRFFAYALHGKTIHLVYGEAWESTGPDGEDDSEDDDSDHSGDEDEVKDDDNDDSKTDDAVNDDPKDIDGGGIETFYCFCATDDIECGHANRSSRRYTTTSAMPLVEDGAPAQTS